MPETPQPISQLPAAGSAGTSDLLPIVQSGTTKKATVAQILANVPAQAPAVIGSASDVDQTTQGAGRVLSNTTSGGKPFSFQDPIGFDPNADETITGNWTFAEQLTLELGVHDTSNESFFQKIQCSANNSPSIFEGGIAVAKVLYQESGPNQWAKKVTLASGTVTVPITDYIAAPVVVATPEGAGVGLITLTVSNTSITVTSSDVTDSRVVNLIIIGNAD